MSVDFFIIVTLFIQAVTLVSSSDLMIFRDQPKLSNISDIYPQHQMRQWMCISDRPRDAIVWNIWWDWYGHFRKYERNLSKAFELSTSTVNHEQQCRVDVDKECLSSWSQQGGNWSIVNSYDVPMGPVYDSRWEKFTELKIKNEIKPLTTIKNGVNTTVKFGATGSLAFSIRGDFNTQILICESEKIRSDFCYQIAFSTWYTTDVSYRINKCENGVPQAPEFRPSSCLPQSKYEHDNEDEIIDYTWKTFVLTWEEKTRTIEVFDTNKKILSYSDHNSTYRNSNKEYHIFYGSRDDSRLFRFHDYAYTLTKDRSAILKSSPLILGSSQELCIDMLVGLCKHCELIVNIIDGSGKRRVTKRIRRSSKYDSIEHDLPMWQNERLEEMNVSDYPTPITLELVTSVIAEESDKSKDHWAITKFEHCLPKEAVKSIKMTEYQDCNEYNCFWTRVYCQRLSYDDPKSEVVWSKQRTTRKSKNFNNCQSKSIGPNCAIKCDSFSQHDCYGVKVYSKDGQSCAQGWQGSNCTTKCSPGSYGFGCSKKCTNCADDSCDHYDGKCNLGCKSTLSQFHQPPYCNAAVRSSLTSFNDELKDPRVRVSRALNFQYEPHPILDHDTSISIVIPPVMNNTKDSQLYVIVKGPSICEQAERLSEQIMKDIGVDDHEAAWHVATFPTQETANLSLTIGGNHMYVNKSNCCLKVGSSYVIVLLVSDAMDLEDINETAPLLLWQSKPILVGDVPKIHYALWAIPLVLVLFIIFGTTYYCIRRRRHQKYLDERRIARIFESISKYPIVDENKDTESNDPNEEDNASNTVDD